MYLICDVYVNKYGDMYIHNDVCHYAKVNVLAGKYFMYFVMYVIIRKLMD